MICIAFLIFSIIVFHDLYRFSNDSHCFFVIFRNVFKDCRNIFDDLYNCFNDLHCCLTIFRNALNDFHNVLDDSYSFFLRFVLLFYYLF